MVGFNNVESLYQDLSTICIDKVVAFSRNYYKVYFLLDFLIQSLILTTTAPFIQGLYETIGKSYCVRHTVSDSVAVVGLNLYLILSLHAYNFVTD